MIRMYPDMNGAHRFLVGLYRLVLIVVPIAVSVSFAVGYVLVDEANQYFLSYSECANEIRAEYRAEFDKGEELVHQKCEWQLNVYTENHRLIGDLTVVAAIPVLGLIHFIYWCFGLTYRQSLKLSSRDGENG